METEIKHVLLVEDEEGHAELIALSFESRGDVRLRVAASLEDAREELARSAPDLVILDSLLPDGRGLELLHEPRLSSCPVILLTSHADEAMRTEALAAGVSQYVVKSEDTLLDMPRIVDGALDRHSEAEAAKPPDRGDA